MKLRYLLLSATGLFVIIGVGIVHYVMRFELLDNFFLIEEKKITTDINRIDALIDQEIERLDIICQDWAYWDDTYYFMDDLNPNYIESNLDPSTLISLQTNYMGFFNLEGTSVYDLWVEHETEDSYTPDWYESWNNQLNFLNDKSMDFQEQSGILTTPDGILLVSAKTILTSEQSGPSKGTLVLGHYLDQHLIEKIENISTVDFEVINYSQFDWTIFSEEEIKRITNHEIVTKYSPHKFFGRNSPSLIAYQVIKNIYQEPEFLIKIERDAEIYQIGVHSVFRFNIIISLIGIFLGIVFIFVFEKGVIQRIETMGKIVQKIGETNDLKLRTPVILNDEITQLSTNINQMVVSLEKTQKDLLQQEGLFRDILENTNLITIILDRNGILKYCNQYLLDLTGYPKEEVLEKDWYKIFVPQEERNTIQQKVFDHGEGLSNYVHGENFILTKSGEKRLISWSNTPVKDRDGNLVQMASIGEDITLKALATEEIRRRETMLQSVLDAVPATIALVKNGVMVWVNDKFEEVTGYAINEMIGTNTEQLYGSKEALETIYKNMLEQIVEKRQGYVRTHWIKKNGQILDIDLWAVSVDPNDIGAGTIVTTMDITEQLKAEENLKNSFDQVKTLVSRMTALRNIDHAITSQDDSSTTTKQILALIRKTLNLDIVMLSLFDNQHHEMRIAAYDSINEDKNWLGKIVLLNEDIHQAIQTNQLVSKVKLTTEDFADLETRLNIPIEQDQYAVVPLIVKGEVLGILEILTNQDVCHGDDCRDFLQAMALQLAIALDNANLTYQKESAFNELQDAYESVIKGWGLALELRDAETGGHSNRVVNLTLTLAQRMGYFAEDLIHLQHGVYLHDIGKMGIPDKILLKEGPLTAEEWVIMRQHPVYAYNLLKGIPYLEKAIEIPYCHHERWNGQGYPQGLAGETIPLGARIFAVIDIWDALTSDRPYRRAWSVEKTVQYLQQQAGIEVDPSVVKEFLKMMVELGEIPAEILG